MTGSPIFSVNFTNRKKHAGSGTRNMIVSGFSWIFAVCEIYWKYKAAGHLMFWKPWPVVDLKKVPSVTKDGFVFWAQRKPNAKLEIYEAFQDRLTFFNRLKWFRLAGFSIFDYWEHNYRTAGHLVFWKPWQRRILFLRLVSRWAVMKLTCFWHIDFKIISCHLSMILFLTGFISDAM